LAGSSIHGVLARTVAAAGREILMVAAQDEFVRPSVCYQAVTV
jgi:pyridoxal/pyridoxine/pyridoxamine kinase